MKNPKLIFVASAFAALVALGCGGVKKPAELPKLYPTTVKVVYDDGTPVDGAIATLLPVEPTGRFWNLTGTTDANGTLVLKTDGQWNGAPAGNYEGTVFKEVPNIVRPSDPKQDAYAESVTRYVDLKYNDRTQSGLTATIKKGKNVVEFQVGEKIEETISLAE